jgi:hypothetical protein
MKTVVLSIVVLLSFSFGYSQKKDSLRSKIVVPWFVERFKISAGGFYIVNNTTIQVDINGADGTPIDAEKDLGFSKEVVTYIANFQWRISRRSRIALNYYNIRRNSTHTLQKDIEFDGNNYPANSSVYSYFNTAIYQFAYGYAFLQKPKYEVGAFIGTHIVGASAGISMNQTSPGAQVRNNFGFTAPVPDLGVWSGYAISNRFAVNVDVSYMQLTINNNSGRLLAFNVTFTYKLVDQLDLSLGYSALDFKVNATKNNATGDFKWGYNGPALALNFSFGKKNWEHPLIKMPSISLPKL